MTRVILDSYPEWFRKRPKKHSEMTEHDQAIIQILETVMLVADPPIAIDFPYRHARGKDLFDGLHFSARNDGIVIEAKTEESHHAAVSFLHDTIGTRLIEETAPSRRIVITYQDLEAVSTRRKIAGILLSALGVTPFQFERSRGHERQR